MCVPNVVLVTIICKFVHISHIQLYTYVHVHVYVTVEPLCIAYCTPSCDIFPIQLHAYRQVKKMATCVVYIYMYCICTSN